ncbi:DNA-directed RNA polymerase specialized sigma24 family protein [Saccharothrix ecbatanensis]|uniref:DNA-directed RNA polymerase specialized sigma24 family protein n=1 Tax=Saccharothrix ecbatanensis TaxID=1105145 RepID=A0A7W9M280_9PSEU|nr:hypothetical protein [Saccharothrix ecbatanensis]MBB5804671.1 DNA-directed RNA polymerase specialized sigma24 family protein [Saccharothrix ecbatanensis]
MADQFTFDFMRASADVDKIARKIIITSGFDPSRYLEDIAQDVRLYMYERIDRLKELVVSKSYQNAVIKHATLNALLPLKREREMQVESTYPRWWIKDNLDDLLDGLSTPTYAYVEDKLTDAKVKQIVINGHDEQDLAIQVDFNRAFTSLTDKQQEALSKDRETASDRSAFSKALDRLHLAMNKPGKIKEEQ